MARETAASRITLEFTDGSLVISGPGWQHFRPRANCLKAARSASKLSDFQKGLVEGVIQSMSEDPNEKGKEGQPAEKDRGEQVHRRGFFTEGLRHLLRPLADIVEDRLQKVGVPMDDDDDVAYPGGPRESLGSVEVPDRPILRPPGALPGEEFLDRCLSSGQCVSVCPVAAIKLARSEDPRLDDKPFIDPEVQACVVCEDLSCMQVCPSGALVPLPKEEICMGIAVLREDICVRGQGEDCQICVDKCPLGTRAIDIAYPGGRVEVHADGCTGCGVCQMYCPTEPRAIVVEPPAGEPASQGGPGGESDPVDSGSYFPVGEEPGAGED